MKEPVDAPTPQSLADLVARCDQINRYETQLTAAEESRVAALASGILVMRNVLELESVDAAKLPVHQGRIQHWALTGGHLREAETPAIHALRGMLALDEHEQVKVLSQRKWGGHWGSVSLWRSGVHGLTAGGNARVSRATGGDGAAVARPMPRGSCLRAARRWRQRGTSWTKGRVRAAADSRDEHEMHCRRNRHRHHDRHAPHAWQRTASDCAQRSSCDSSSEPDRASCSSSVPSAACAAFRWRSRSSLRPCFRRSRAPTRRCPATPRAAAARERALEAAAIARPDRRARVRTRARCRRETHVAGHAGAGAHARLRHRADEGDGARDRGAAYDVFMPHPTARARLARVAGHEGALARRAAGAGDPTSALAQYRTVNGYSAAGDVTAEVVYVNYGLIEDYAQLDSLGVSVRGKIAVARYGRSFRGIKAREAEKHGAVALLIYSDPQDDGYVRGDVYPDGPMRQPERRAARQRVQRRRRPVHAGLRERAGRTAHRPRRRWTCRTSPWCRSRTAMPASCCGPARPRHAAGVAGRAAVPLSRRARPGARARAGDRRPRDARRRSRSGTPSASCAAASCPDELVIVGGHRDGWGPGAADNVSGTVSVLEAARAVAER